MMQPYRLSPLPTKAGHEYASIQAAHMFAGKLNENRIDLDLAENLIDNVEAQIEASRFHCSTGLYGEYLQTKLNIKLKLISTALPADELTRVTTDLIHTLMTGARYRIEGFAAACIGFIAPDAAPKLGICDIQEFCAARAIISQCWAAEQLCQDQAKDLQFIQLLSRRYEGEANEYL